MKIEDKAYFEMQPNLQGMKKVRDEIYALAQTHLRLSEKSTDSQKQNYEYRIAAGLSSFVNRAPYAAEIGMEFKGSAYWNKKAIQLAKEGAALGVIADKLIAEALSIYNSHSKPIEDKRYFAISPAETKKQVALDIKKEMENLDKTIDKKAKELENTVWGEKWTGSPDLAKKENNKFKQLLDLKNQLQFLNSMLLGDGMSPELVKSSLKNSVSKIQKTAGFSKPVEDKRYFAVSPAETEKKILDLTAAWRKLMNVADNLHGMANPSPEIMKRQDQVDADMERIGNQIAELKKSIGVQENVSVRLAKPVEDKAYFDKRIEVETWKSPKGTTYIAGLDQGSGGLFQPFITATYSDGGQQLMTGNPPRFKTEGGARKWLSAEITKRKTPNARQGSKAKFAATRIWPNDYGEINNANAKYARLIFDRQKIIRANAGRRIKGEQPLEVPAPPTAPEFPFAFADGDYVGLVLGGQANVPKGATVKWAHNANSIKMSRTGTKAKFASDTNYAHKNTIKIKGKSDKIYALIYAEEGYGDNLTGFWNGHVQNNSNPKVNDVVTIGQFKSKEAAKAAAIKALKQEEQGTNFSKAKFANRGAFAEASSSPVLGSLLEKKVMPEGGWRAVETDGSALIIAFEDNDIAGNFARRASENGYSATAPMAMAGRFWNVKVQNENKN